MIHTFIYLYFRMGKKEIRETPYPEQLNKGKSIYFYLLRLSLE